MQPYMSRDAYDKPRWAARQVLFKKVMTQAASAEDIKLWFGWQLLNEVSDCLASGKPALC